MSKDYSQQNSSTREVKYIYGLNVLLGVVGVM